MKKNKTAQKGDTFIKHFSQYLPTKTLDQMYKTLVRPHFNHCHIIYHIPSITNPYGRVVTLNYLMERLEIRFSIKQR